jgi:hypothetical protein
LGSFGGFVVSSVEEGVIDNDDDTNGYGESSSRNTSNARVPEIRITDTAVAAPK